MSGLGTIIKLLIYIHKIRILRILGIQRNFIEGRQLSKWLTWRQMVTEAMVGNLRGERLQIMLSPDELSAVDSFRYQHRMPSRAAAVRELLQMGLAAAGTAQNGDGRKSSEFGVFGRGPQGHSSGEEAKD